MAQYDLTSKISQNLDRHLVAPLLEFIAGQNIYNQQEVLQSKLDLLVETKMVDYAIDVFKKLHPEKEIPPKFMEKRTKVVEEYKSVQESSKPITAILESAELAEQISNSRDYRQLVEYLAKAHNFKPEMIDSIYDYAKLYYECGDYSTASQYLNLHNELVPSSDKNYLSGLWGKLACNILLHQWEYGLEDFEKLKTFIDEDPFRNALQTLQQRTWLLHWGLYLYFNHTKGWDFLLDLLSNNAKYLNVIQTTCPHILRYWATAVIISKHSRHSSAMKELVAVIQQETYTYKDPITEFIKCLHVNFDFDGAQQKLKECERVLSNDFFLISCYNDFIDHARLMIFETFCRIHQCISIGMLAEKLDMTTDEAERWIVNLIRNARLDAKLDSKLGHVVMGTSKISPYQQIIGKTEFLNMRSQVLANSVARKLGDKSSYQIF
ncbi:eukaryotic translation initiation factor 3 subunit E-B [Folsomia candida]|uniref:Eukaryotic translation initiation factor 3 subunit E n=1 Tax=Folsomia candida TaxID=158441 RepID=A0A226EZE0_FOLCA|nr:eukaryotic translation initiation factor 3 subunit E-B [Folsomia candida]OXA62558.1 Eukaryotic translation initiation factor 3 subunit E-B [Folsomia candida]QBH73838.1 eukaryotic translation initiation factor 3 subunit E [Folsomia candida]